MKAPIFAIGTIALQLVLGNLCMMPMAAAEDMHDMPGMNHDMATMASHESEAPVPEGMPCDGGHCFVHALPTQTLLSTDGMLVAALPVTPNVMELSFESNTPVPVSMAPPGQFIHVKTIVLRN